MNADTSSPAAVVVADDNRTLAILAHIGGLLTSWIAPLVLMLVSKPYTLDGAFARDNAREALNFQITLLLAYFVAFALSFILIGILVFWGLFLMNLILCIVAAVHASNGQTYRYPFTLRLVK